MHKVKFVKLHSDDTHVPGIGSIGNTLPHPSKSFDLEMRYDEKNLFLTINNVKAMIPAANIKILVVDEEVKTPLKVVNAR